MTSTVEYLGELRTKMTHSLSGEIVLTDAPRDNEGNGAFFSPTDLMATSLASCMLTVMGIKARQHGWNIMGTRTEIIKKMENSPRRIGRIDLRISVPGIHWSASEKQILINTALSCPVAQSLHPQIELNIEWVWEH